MSYSFEENRLWRSGFSGDDYSEHKQRLRQSYCAFWARACELTKMIAVDLPGLTLHDERHLEALWKRADLIAGEDYKLNPLELFVFGGGLLLHDAGLTLAAYPRGLVDLKSTLEWQDAAALRDLPDAKEIGGVSEREQHETTTK